MSILIYCKLYCIAGWVLFLYSCQLHSDNCIQQYNNENYKEASHLQSRTQAALSDDEDVVHAMKMRILHV